MRLVKSLWPALALSFVVTSVVYMPVCNAVFSCGCTWPLLGGVQHCNIHVPGPPDCPVCTGGVPIQAAGFFAIFAPVFGLASGAQRLLSRRARS